MKFLLCIAAAFCASAAAISASEVYGEIKLDTRVAKKSLPPSVYDLRGMVPHEKNPQANTGSFQRVAVWLEGGSGTAPPLTGTMRQVDRRFDPGLLIVPTGSKVEFPNFDPLFHNIFSLSPVLPFDLGYYAEGKSREMVFPKPGVIQVFCHVHPEMYGVIVITSSRWTAKPAADGTFSFAGVAPGHYKAVVWQRLSGLVSKNISVPASGEVRVSFKLPNDDGDQ